MVRNRLLIALAVLPCSVPLQAQSTATDAGRATFASWLAAAPTSPLKAIAHQRIGTGLTLGPEGAIVLPDAEAARVVTDGGRVVLEQGTRRQPLTRGVPKVLGPYRLLAGGIASRTTLTVFGDAAKAKQTSWYPVSRVAIDTVTLAPGSGARVTLLAPDGTDVEAIEAGTVTVKRFGLPATLTVRRFPGASDDESELEIFFRDSTNSAGSYPAGRFITLVPLGGNRYLADFNSARNPWCAYNTVFPCPAPWPGNTIRAKVEAGEKYGD